MVWPAEFVAWPWLEPVFEAVAEEEVDVTLTRVGF
jgi:hypothetical protein